jgi:flagellar motor protein MotB
MATWRRDRYSKEAPWVVMAALFGFYLVGQGKHAVVPMESAHVAPVAEIVRPPAVVAKAPEALVQVKAPAFNYGSSLLPKSMIDMVEAISHNKKFRGLNGVTMTALQDRVEIVLPSGPLFAGGSADTTSTAQKELELIGRLLKGAGPGFNIIVEGHTDSTPVVKNKNLYPSNMELSADRAMKVVKLLHDAGIDTSRLKGVGYGATRPIAQRDPSNVAKPSRGEDDKRIVLRLEPSLH